MTTRAIAASAALLVVSPGSASWSYSSRARTLPHAGVLPLLWPTHSVYLCAVKHQTRRFRFGSYEFVDCVSLPPQRLPGVAAAKHATFPPVSANHCTLRATRAAQRCFSGGYFP